MLSMLISYYVGGVSYLTGDIYRTLPLSTTVRVGLVPVDRAGRVLHHIYHGRFVLIKLRLK